MITGLCMHNFKSWKDTGQVRIAPLTGLFGTNSSGKTAILQMLLLLKQTVESNDRAKVLNIGDQNTYVDLGSVYDIIYGKHIPTEIGISINWKSEKGASLYIKNRNAEKPFEFVQFQQISFTCSILVTKNKSRVKEFHYTAKHGNKDYLFGMREKLTQKKPSLYEFYSEGYQLEHETDKLEVPIDTRLPFGISKFYGFPYSFSIFHNDSASLDELVNNFEALFGSIFYLGPLRDYPHRTYLWSGQKPQDVGTKGERSIEALLATDQSVTEKIAYWLKELKLVHNFSVKPIAPRQRLHEVLVQSYENGPEVPITDVGFGVSQLLPVLVLCYYVPEGATVLLEQPEIHLHPSVQAGLADIFIDVIKNRGLQIILESHSEHLLRRLQRRIAEEEFSEEQAALYFCEQNDQGESQIMSLKLDEYGNITNWPKNFFGDDFEDISAMTEAAIRRKKAAKGK